MTQPQAMHKRPILLYSDLYPRSREEPRSRRKERDQKKEDHVRGALEAGASKREVAETLLLTASEGAGTQLAWRREVFEKYLEGGSE